jgi:c-di-GMP-binding flagellar brake protein YcgR
MTGAEKIQGKKLIKLMEHVQRERIMLSMRLVGQNYERLTMITRIPKDKKASFFAIDPPRDFKDNVAEMNACELQFKFNGSDNLEYIFTTFGGKFSDDETQIKFPYYIERLQRRRYFRLSVPMDTKLFFKLGQFQREINLINISMRGALGVLDTFNGENQKKPILKKEDYLKNIEIVFPSDIENDERKLKVIKAIIRRAEHNRQKNIDIYALEFVSMDKNEEKMLTQIIYNLQRMFLQKK